MRYSEAKFLRKGDVLVDKTTGESVTVLSIKRIPARGWSPSVMAPCVLIEGVGARQGRNQWQHTRVSRIQG